MQFMQYPGIYLWFIICMFVVYVYLYLRYGRHYAIGSAEYAKSNNVQINSRFWKQEDFKQSITNETYELIDAINKREITNIILELADVFQAHICL